MENFEYLRVFKQANIDPCCGEKICSLLSAETLKKITKVGIDRRIIKPLLEKASRMPNGLNDSNVNALLDDQNYMIQLNAECRGKYI